MKRFVFNSLALVSLLLCLGMAGLWVRSYWVEDSFGGFVLKSEDETREEEHSDEVSGWFVWSRHGCCGLDGEVETTSRSLARSVTAHGWGWHRRSPDPETGTWAGFKLARTEERLGRSGFSRSIIVCVPHWFPTLVFAIAPSWWLLHQRKRRALQRAGCCKTCGYDLRATPERCPECGTVQAAAPSS